VLQRLVSTMIASWVGPMIAPFAKNSVLAIPAATGSLEVAKRSVRPSMCRCNSVTPMA
jgi:hypothetical protein